MKCAYNGLPDQAKPTGEAALAEADCSAAEPGLFGLCLCGSPLVMDGEHMICGAYRLKILADLKALPRRTAEEATRRQNDKVSDGCRPRAHDETKTT